MTEKMLIEEAIALAGLTVEQPADLLGKKFLCTHNGNETLLAGELLGTITAIAVSEKKDIVLTTSFGEDCIIAFDSNGENGGTWFLRDEAGTSMQVTLELLL